MRISFILAFITLLINTTSFAQKSIKIGDQLNVFASSGLNLRSEPHLDSRVLQKIKYDEAVKVVNILEKDVIDHRKGHWLKVDYDGARGYLFSGYLSQLILPYHDIEDVNNCSQNDFLETWILENLEQLTPIYDCDENINPQIETSVNWRSFGNGDRISYHIGKDSHHFQFESYHFTMNDLLNYIDFDISVRKNCSDPKSKHRKNIKNVNSRFSLMAFYGNINIIQQRELLVVSVYYESPK